MTAPHTLYRLALSLLLLGSIAFFPSPVLSANGAVGTGSPESCTEAAFDTVFNAVQSSGGGTITFKCGAAQKTIIFSAQKSISAPTVIQGGALITLSGGNATSLFQVFSGKSLTLSQITLTRGSGSFGAVENFGSLIVNNSQFLNNTASNAGGAIQNYGSLTLKGALIANNTAAQLGGGIHSDTGSVTIANSQFTGNTAVEGGGGIAGVNGASLSISASQFSENKTSGTFAQGGAVQSAGTLKVNGSEFMGNSASRGGGVSVMGGSANIDHTLFRGNWAAYGGGIRQEAGDLTLTDVGLTGNGYAANGAKVTTGGGAISWGDGSALLSKVEISNNWASYGGGFDHEKGTTTLINVTMNGNTAVGSGAIDQAGGSIDLTNVTIADNAASFFAGGITNRGGTAALKNVLLSNNIITDINNPEIIKPGNCYKPIAASSFSLSGDFTCSFGAGRDSIPLILGPLADNGGYTQTQLPVKDSPAIDAGTGAGCPKTDQRGVTRPQGEACDVGAVEFAPGDLWVKLFLPFTIR